jgi:uncharacterized protein (DUF58 family)
MLETLAFEPEFLKKLDGLVLASRPVRMLRAGRRNTGRMRGSGIEPEDFREYAEGDDLRFLDWNALARLDDLNIRTFRPERQVEVTIMIDASASMALPARDDKLGLALVLGAGLAYVAMNENEPARLVAFTGRRGTLQLETTPFRRRRETYIDLRPFVLGLKCGGKTQLAEAVGRMLHERRPSGVVIVVSDFLVGPDEYERALSQLVAARHDVKVIHLMGEQESTAAYPPGSYRVRDCETGQLRDVSFGPKQAEACRRRIGEHSERLRGFCQRRGIMYSPAFGASHLDEIVAREFPRLGVFA